MTKHNSNYRIGIVGGGQLARLLAQAAIKFGCELVILERNANSPALSLAAEVLIGDWDDPEQLLKLAQRVDVVTLENEFIDANALQKIENAGHKLFPSAATIGLVQDKLIQKQTLFKAGIPMPTFRQVNNVDEVINAANDFSWPLLLKARRNGYDGNGNATIHNEKDVAAAWQKLGGDKGNLLYVEAFCPFEKELAVMITRDQQGDMAVYPVVETVQKEHICHIVNAPAMVDNTITEQAINMAKKAVATIDAVGTIGVEMFLDAEQQIWLNEMAPRVHNSGHYTIEACYTSQFENHIRAISAWPLGNPDMCCPVAVMVNLLGAANGSGEPLGIEHALAIDGINVHSYAKTESRPKRKMGHVTLLGESMPDTLQQAQLAAQKIQYGEAT